MPAELQKVEHYAKSYEDDDKHSISMGDLESSVGFLLRIAQLSLFERFFEILGQSDVKISELTVLVAISENPGVRQGILADVLRIKWSNMTKLVRTLEERDWIKRHIPPQDRRSVELYVTEVGRAQLDSVLTRMNDSDRQAVSMLSDSEHTQLLQLARKVAGWPPLPTERDA